VLPRLLAHTNARKVHINRKKDNALCTLSALFNNIYRCHACISSFARHGFLRKSMEARKKEMHASSIEHRAVERVNILNVPTHVLFIAIWCTPGRICVREEGEQFCVTHKIEVGIKISSSYN
jgi:hypothetical protein